MFGRHKKNIPDLPERDERGRFISTKKDNEDTPLARNITMDTSVVIAFLTSKKEGGIVRKVFAKAKNQDDIQMTDIIWDEAVAFSKKLDTAFSEEQIKAFLANISETVIQLKPLPELEELVKKYKIRDSNDLQILYSAEMTKSVILITRDKDFDDAEGLDIELMDMVKYLYEHEIPEKKLLRRRK